MMATDWWWRDPAAQYLALYEHVALTAD